MKRFLAICLIMLFLCAAPGCGQNFSEEAQTPRQSGFAAGGMGQGSALRLALAGTKTLNPILAENEHNLQILKLIYDGLFVRSNTDAVESVLCESYTVSPDGLTYEFTLKPGVSFHNGTSLTAEDVTATLALLLSTDGLYKNRLSSVSAYSGRDMKLTITLLQPVANFTALLDFPVLSAEDLARGYDSATYVPNGTGRYKVQSYKKSKELYLSVNENYHRSFEPQITSLVIYLLKDAATAVTMLENLQLDLLTSDVLNLRVYTPRRSLSTAEYANGGFTFIGLNNQQPSLLSALTRTALASALDRQAILTSCGIPYAQAADLPLPAGSYWNTSPVAGALDAQQIKSLLAEDGWQDADGDGTLDKLIYGEPHVLTPEILVNEENQTRLRLAEQVRSAWQAAGIPARISAVPFAEYERRIAARQYDAFIGGVTLLENYDLSFLLKTDANPFGVSVERIDQSLNALLLMDRESQKQILYHELCDSLRSSTPIIGLYFENDILVYDSRIEGEITPSGSDIFYGIENWSLKD